MAEHPATKVLEGQGTTTPGPDLVSLGLAALDVLPDGIAIFDGEERFTYYNARYPQHVTAGLRETLALGVRFDDWVREGLARGPIYHPDMGRDFAERRLAMRAQDVSEHEHRLVDGRWLRIREARTRDGGRILLTTDITEARRRDEDLRLLATATEEIADQVEITSADNRFVFVNRAFERITGWTREEAIGRRPQELLSSGHHPASFFEAMARHLESGQIWHGTIVNRRKDGAIIEQETTISPIVGEAGGVTHFIAIKRDVTETRAQARALATSEARYRAVVETQTEFLARFEPSGRWTFMNEASRRYIGMGVEEMNALDIRDPDFVHPDDLPIYHAHMAALTPDHPTDTIEMRTVHPDGSLHWEQWTDTGIFDADGALIEYQCAGREITDKKLAEIALKEREAQFRAIAENVPVALVISDIATAEPFYMNPLARLRHGVGPEAPLPDTMLGAWEDLADRQRLLDDIARDGRAEVEAQLVSLDGRRSVALVSGTIMAYAGREALLTGSVDISDLREAQAALSASEARLKAIIAANPLAMSIARMSDRRLLFINEPYVRMFGLEGVDQDTFDRARLYTDPGDRDRIFREIAAGRSITNLELTLRRLDGTEVPATLTARPILFQGEPAVVTSSVDLTTLRAAEAEIARQREALHQSEKMTALGSLLAGVAHELNNPLSVVVGYSSMLRDLVDQPEMRVRLERLHSAAERCARIVRSFLAMARARPPSRGPVDLEEVVRGALELAAYGLRSADVSIETDFPTGLPPALGDADQLHQVILNLVVNAQHALMGSPAPRTLSVRGRRQREWLELTVADNGPGMDAETARRAFEPFFSTKPQGMGTGVGLSVCHGIVTAHGGSIRVETAPGAGARFVVRLPSAESAGAATAPAVTAGRASGRVLVVDDEPDLTQLIADQLHSVGLTPVVVTSGQAALAALAAEDCDAMITDLRMPGMDGAALASAARRLRPGLAGRILLMTGDSLGADVAFGAGERPLLDGLRVYEKPLDLAALTADLVALIGGRRP